MQLSFLDPQLMKRLENSPREKDYLRNALGKGKFRILDATAGLCRDSLRMAFWGHEVCACERDSKLSQLLVTAYTEALADDFYAPWLNRLKIHALSTEAFLAANPHETFDIVVVDSMFPDEKRKGLPKKNIQELKLLVEDDSDNAAELLNFLYDFKWEKKPKKILVKRPLKAPPFPTHKASMAYKGRSHRWDLYLP